MTNRIIYDAKKYTSDENKNLNVSQIKKLQARKNKLAHVSSIGGWNTEMVRNAIEQQSTGNFEGTTRLGRKMMSDAAFSAALNKRINSLIRSEFYLEPSDKESEAAKVISDSILSVWFDCIPEHTIKQLLRNYLLLGVALAFTTWKNKEGVWLPEVEVYNTEFLKYDQNLTKWLYRTANGQIEVTPNDGNWILISEWEPGNTTGFVSQLAECYINKKFAERDQAVGNENHIDSICIIQDNGLGVNQEQNTLDDFSEEIQDKKRDRVIALPPGYTVNFQDAMSSYKPEAFTNVIDYCDKKFQISILGGNLSSEVTGGSYAAAQTHQGVELQLTQGDEAIMSTALHNQLLTHVVSVNYGDAVSKQYTPWPHWKTTPPEDLNKSIEILTKIKSLIGEQQIANLEELLVPFNVKLSNNNNQ